MIQGIFFAVLLAVICVLLIRFGSVWFVSVLRVIGRLRAIRTPPTPPGTPPPVPPPTPPTPPTRSVWGTRVVLGAVVVGVLVALVLLFGKEARELVPTIPEVPDVPIPQSRGEIIQWIEGIDWRWSDWGWVLPYLVFIPAGVVSHYFSVNTATGYKVWKVTLQTMLYTLLAVFAFQFQDVLVAFFGMLGVSVDGVLVSMLLSVDFKPLYVVTLIGSFLLLWLAFYGITSKAMLYAFGVAALYTLTISQVVVTELSSVNGIWALSALAMLGLVVNGYVLRASMLALGTTVLLALLHT